MIRRMIRKLIIWAMDWDQVDLLCQKEIHKADPAKMLEKMRTHNRGIFTEPDDFEYGRKPHGHRHS